MQQLVNVIRATGARQPISFNASDVEIRNDVSCWNGVPASVASTVPLVNGEVGEQLRLESCRWSFMRAYLAWAEGHDVSFAAWKYGVDLGTCVNMALIRDPAGYPTPIYGQRYRAWLAAH
jgi:hypothetical protein